jgi:GntR family transcriptional regulator/MocR family aminotransferase
MSAGRRIALVKWARHHRAFVIEDDYDGEFRYDRQPVGALQRLDPERVIYAGSTSKTLAPGLRLGWLSAPGAMIGALAAAKEHADRGTSILDQLTLAGFIRGGAFDRHIRRMRGTYRRRRDELVQLVAAHPGGARLAGIAAGLHGVLYLPGPDADAERLRSRAAGNSVAVETLASYWRHPPDPCPQGLVIGFGTPAGHAYRPALRALMRLL